MRGGALAAALSGLQALLLFWSVLRAPVFLVLCWTVTAPHVLRAALDAAATRRLPPHGRFGALVASLVCAGGRVGGWVHLQAAAIER